jgi:hypothetical protein
MRDEDGATVTDTDRGPLAWVDWVFSGTEPILIAALDLGHEDSSESPLATEARSPSGLLPEPKGPPVSQP